MKGLKEIKFSDTQMQFFRTQAAARGLSVPELIEEYTKRELYQIAGDKRHFSASIIPFKGLKSPNNKQ